MTTCCQHDARPLIGTPPCGEKIVGLSTVKVEWEQQTNPYRTECRHQRQDEDANNATDGTGE